MKTIMRVADELAFYADVLSPAGRAKHPLGLGVGEAGARTVANWLRNGAQTWDELKPGTTVTVPGAEAWFDGEVLRLRRQDGPWTEAVHVPDESCTGVRSKDDVPEGNVPVAKVLELVWAKYETAGSSESLMLEDLAKRIENMRGT